MRLTWAQPEDLVAHEFVALRAEGIDPSDLESIWSNAGGSLVAEVSGASKTPGTESLRELARELLLRAEDLPNEPRREATAEFPIHPSIFTPASVDSHLYGQRIRGAWWGRLVGCLLGKPVEKIPRQGIEAIGRATNNWPVGRYFTEIGLPAEITEKYPWNRRSRPTSLEENINGMPEDDDINYPLLALELLEANGADFTSDDVVQLWLDNLPAGRVFTAERAAYRNILDARPVPECGYRFNPFREWIGALIRGDVFGWVNPGRPIEAAYMAWKDARISHSRNGIYGEMWAAALTSSAMTAASPEEALEQSMVVVPSGSALDEAIRYGCYAATICTSLEHGLDLLHETYGHLHWVHVLNNAATIAFAIQYAEGDFVQAIRAGISAGWDTDSVGATIGGVLGAFVGFDGIDPYWTDPLKNSLSTSLPGMHGTSVDAVIERTIALKESLNHV